jgi:hypothetical protein
MTTRRHRQPTVDARRQRPSDGEVERRHRQVLRVFAQTAVACAVIGGSFLLTGNHTLNSMALFLLAWAAGWGFASGYLLGRKAVKSARRRDER